MRQITYTVSADGQIQPKTRQWAGMQYEDKATEVIYDISALGDISALYRIDLNSAAAGHYPSENLEAENGKIKIAIPDYITQYGGEIQVTAVVTMLDEEGNETGMSLSYPAIVYLTDVEKDDEGEKEIIAHLSPLEASAKDSAERAEKAAEFAEESKKVATEAQELTEFARRALEEGTEFVFVGGDAESVMTVDIAVDDELSTVSENPVQNKLIATPLLDAQSNANRAIEAVNDMGEDVQDIRTDVEILKSKVYPIGSIYCGSDLTNPSAFFGGEWLLIDKEFAPKTITNGLEVNSVVVSGNAVNGTITGHTVQIVINMVNIIDIGDDNNVRWGKLDPQVFGCTEFSRYLSILSINDGANGSVMFEVAKDGTINSGDTIGSRPLKASGSNNNFHIIYNQTPETMIDEFCNKFYWKRIS